MTHPRLLLAGAVVALTAALAGGGAAAAAAGTHAQATIHAASAKVDGRTERILVTATGLPLYTYAHDTATVSHVSATLASVWPPLLSGHPTESGVTGKLTIIRDRFGPQVRYKGHFLYTFLADTPDHVTGQGVSDFFVATP